MAKAGKLAGLAALAGAAYTMSKDKNKGPAGKEDTGAGYQSTETRLESPQDTIKRSMKKAPADAESNMQTDMLKAITAPKSAPNDQAPNQGVLSSKSSAPKPAAKDRRVVSPEESMAKYKPRYTPSAMAPKTTQGATYEKKPYMPEDVDMGIGQKRGGMVKKMASGGMTASRRADGIATKGKTRGKIC